MKSSFCFLLLTLFTAILAAEAPKVGDSFDAVAPSLGKPTLIRITEGNGMANYADGTRIKVKGGKIVSVEKAKVTPPTPKEEAIPDTNIWKLSEKEAAAKEAAKNAGKAYHASLLKDIDASLLRGAGKKATIASINRSPYLFIYFSAHWCAPCRQFTPKLVEWYRKHFTKGDFEILFVSSDRDQAAMESYMKEAEMPWLGLKLSHPLTTALKKKYEVTGIPALVLLDEKDALLASSFKNGEYLGPDAALKEYQARH